MYDLCKFHANLRNGKSRAQPFSGLLTIRLRCAVPSYVQNRRREHNGFAGPFSFNTGYGTILLKNSIILIGQLNNIQLIKINS